MKIAIDISPIDDRSKSGHKVRGVGKYITLLRDNLEKFDRKNTYIFINNPQEIKETVDIIHYPYFDPFFITLPLINKTTTVVTVHDVIPLVHKKEFPVGIKGEIKWKYNRYLLRRLSGIITDSVASKEDIHKITKIQNNKIYSVKLSVDDEFESHDLGYLTSDIRKKYNLPKDFFLYVGDVTWNKNLPRIIEAVKISNVTLVMVGKVINEIDFDKSNPWNKDRLEVLSKTENDPSFVKLGFVPTNDLVSLYRTAKALLMPSLDEGFGLPVLEAMKAGCVVITSRCGSLPEVGGESVFYVKEDNIKDIASGIKKIDEDENLRACLRLKGLKHAEGFTIKKMIEGTIASYESIYSHDNKS